MTSLSLSSPDFYGVSEITVIVSDGFLADTTSFFVTIEPTNDAPIISPIAEQYSLENTVFIYDLELTDIDTGDRLSHYITPPMSGGRCPGILLSRSAESPF